MLTLHVAAAGPAVLVEGRLVAAVGGYEDLSAAHPGARVRHWPGEIAPGRVRDGVRALLEDTFHPDAYLPGRPDHRGESVRRGIHVLLGEGVTAVVDDLTDPAVRAAVDRSGLVRVPAGHRPVLTVGGRADLAVIDGDGGCVATVLAGRLVHRRR
ncbi:imidazolonepropionase-like domain-containing protein [Streptomyces fulvorobeus]|uniref:Aminodeoxyfutalosine deaminase/Imidazolonepropionase-like composite domain-containing protein n=1 Tax=Streptomyces fulvorobeus TaxID=284028 RepID=A0A7J0C8B5_9ACTN|nr:hypothetical protein [Streptomyces fulvorobeus]NYE42319.1 hypothetical protein [Streptomyces fulvorobeus]GFM98711.1 hypothetical protein Sfulv_35220 [Streptomyces fulvorobeus]